LVQRILVLVDFNQIGKQHGYVHVKWEPSPDNRYLAYSLDTTGDEFYKLQIRDLSKNCILVKEINNVDTFEWANGTSLYYTVYGKNQSHLCPSKVQVTRIESDDDDVVIYTEHDSSRYLDISCCKDCEFMTVYSWSMTSSSDVQIYVMNLSKPLNGLTTIHKCVSSGDSCSLEHHQGFFYIMTNARLSEKNITSGNYYMIRCRVEDVESNIWQIIIPPSEDLSLQEMDMFNEYMVLLFNKNGSPTMCSIKLPIDSSCKNNIMNIDDLDPWFFPVPSESCTIAPAEDYNHNFMSSVYRAEVSSPLMSARYVDYYMSHNRSTLEEDEDIQGSVSESLDVESISSDNEDVEVSSSYDGYALERKEVISHDGVGIPLTIMYSHKMYEKGKSPGILHGYGAYGRDCSAKDWCPLRFCLLDAGWVFAFADVRGGGGKDSCWHKNGSGLNKTNSIKDFVSCGEFLINEGYVHQHRLGAVGGSAGGLLVGAAINMSPHLFRAAILRVPLLDVCNSLLDPSLPFTLGSVGSRREYGNPEIKLELEAIRSYSPYSNVRSGVCYPSMLVTAHFHDSRVGVWEGAKWVAKIRESTRTNGSSVVLKTSMVGGHLGEHRSHSQYRNLALIKVMGGTI
jgi:protease II